MALEALLHDLIYAFFGHARVVHLVLEEFSGAGLASLLAEARHKWVLSRRVAYLELRERLEEVLVVELRQRSEDLLRLLLELLEGLMRVGGRRTLRTLMLQVGQRRESESASISWPQGASAEWCLALGLMLLDFLVCELSLLSGDLLACRSCRNFSTARSLA